MSLYSRLSVVSLLALLLISCSRSTSTGAPSVDSAPGPGSASAASTPPASERYELPYPRAAWRLADPAEVGSVVLWVSQILVRHADVRNEVSFNMAYWSSVPPPATRSRSEALELARQLAQRAARDPAQFRELARQYSEDLPSRDEGGELGGIPATQLESWPQVLDALATLRPGQVSLPVETRYGFHIFYRSAPPAEELLSGSHLVIGHERAQWLPRFARGTVPRRSRDEALALANDLYRKARSEPSRFGELVRQFSEHRDAVVDGDFGAWSTREPSSFPPRMKRLRELRVGEVGSPIETHLGFEIVQRTAPRPRGQYRARMLAVPVDPADTQAPRYDQAARSRAYAQAEDALRRLALDPAALDPAALDAPATDSTAGDVPGASQFELQWEEGRELPELALLLEQTPIGQLTSRPAASEYGLIVARRLAPQPLQRPSYRTELPLPEQPDPAVFLGSLSARSAQTFLREFAANLQEEIGVSNETAGRLRTIHALDGLGEETPDPVRRQLLSDVFSRSRELLGDQAYARYQAALIRQVRAELLEPPEPSSRLQLGF